MDNALTMARGGTSQDEFDLNEYKKDCKKNNQHENFILFMDFQLHNIPPRFRTPDLYRLIQQLGLLTVKIKVKRLCRKSQGSDSNWNALNGFYQENNGSGRIIFICDLQNPCKYCLASSGAESKHLIIATSHHLVSNETEANETECYLNFDGPEIQSRTLFECQLLECDNEKDTCRLSFKLHDSQLTETLKVALKHIKHLSVKLHKKYSKVKDEDKLCIIVAHPHGCYKYVAFGTWQKDRGNFMYDTSTCPASSGGSVFLLGVNINDLVHMGVCETGQGCSNIIEEQEMESLIMTERIPNENG
uniref:Peptidase S1 domain-containing protein n=1 Tax=Biomphalaria glabrata TaxID=6526 RepID=A0A2C9LGM7_BIOGL